MPLLGSDVNLSELSRPETNCMLTSSVGGFRCTSAAKEKTKVAKKPSLEALPQKIKKLAKLRISLESASAGSVYAHLPTHPDGLKSTPRLQSIVGDRV
jgi:hypothetical protein